MKLDVGCGNFPRGDVNIDLRGAGSVHRFCRDKIRVKAIKNFVRADAEHLPFRNKIFPESISSHSIEHVKNPVRMISEMKRVTRGTVNVISPLSCSYEYLFWLRERVHTFWFLPHWFKKSGFKTNIVMKLIRPELLNRQLPLWFPYFEIVACISTLSCVRELVNENG